MHAQVRQNKNHIAVLFSQDGFNMEVPENSTHLNNKEICWHWQEYKSPKVGQLEDQLIQWIQIFCPLVFMSLNIFYVRLIRKMKSGWLHHFWASQPCRVITGWGGSYSLLCSCLRWKKYIPAVLQTSCRISLPHAQSGICHALNLKSPSQSQDVCTK